MPELLAMLAGRIAHGHAGATVSQSDIDGLLARIAAVVRDAAVDGTNLVTAGAAVSVPVRDEAAPMLVEGESPEISRDGGLAMLDGLSLAPSAPSVTAEEVAAARAAEASAVAVASTARREATDATAAAALATTDADTVCAAAASTVAVASEAARAVAANRATTDALAATVRGNGNGCGGGPACGGGPGGGHPRRLPDGAGASPGGRDGAAGRPAG
ncbi:hypothetical protein [Falsiroseomonas oryzae]|uniref:hypothetical protein n=1 Tax=Falsiroseomonas oryzae TaxID=2766473 RepID=UPI0022EAF1DA|nr:hypothetical protein [Roseomonas sp. MO-31]